MAENLIKVPVKGILKNSSSFEATGSHKCHSSRATKWDEMNILATHHPPDKDYGHMKIEEPKTPYSYNNGEESGDEGDGAAPVLDSDLLAEKLKVKKPFPVETVEDEDESDEEYENETPEERAKRKSFESKRKAHYNEFMAVKLARQLMEREEDEEDEDGDPKEKDNKGDQDDEEDDKADQAMETRDGTDSNAAME